MKLTLAKHAGFCFGVKRAVSSAYEIVNQQHEQVYMLGPVIHNPQVVDELKAMGAKLVESTSQIPDGACAILRAHGEGKAVHDELEKRNIRITDTVCPFVKRIHELVASASKEGRFVYVIGDGTHPEVRGILGWCEGVAVSTEEEVRALNVPDNAVAVSQTTISREQFDRISGLLKEKNPTIEIQNTICSTTSLRQQEAQELARQCDVMLVIGSRSSSNTMKLATLCRRYCEKTYLAETVRDVQRIKFHPTDHIGITAGASTPEMPYKEVVTLMENNIQEVLQDNATMADFEKTMVQLRPGQVVTGTVIQITADEVCVNVGYKSDGLVKKEDLVNTDVKVGDEIEVEVVKVNDGEGNVLLSQRNIIDRKTWDELVAAKDNEEYVTGKGVKVVKGGLLAEVKGVTAFIPASLVANNYVEKLDDMVGQEMTLKIIETDSTKKRIVASRKAVLQAESEAKKKEIWASLEVGQIVTGTVVRLQPFGAFVDIGGVDGLIHVSQLSNKMIAKPEDVVAIGQEVQAKITSLDEEKGRIALSIKALMPRPWDYAAEKYPVGSIVEGKVVRIMSYGAFVELEPRLDGMVHISHCAPRRIEKVEDVVKVDDIVRVKVLDVNTEKKRISLSIREAIEEDAMDDSDLDLPETEA